MWRFHARVGRQFENKVRHNYLHRNKKEANKMAERKAVIKNADMSEDMQQDAVDCASQALEKYNIEKVRLCVSLLSYISHFPGTEESYCWFDASLLKS
jgi:hypothetical protein